MLVAQPERRLHGLVLENRTSAAREPDEVLECGEHIDRERLHERLPRFGGDRPRDLVRMIEEGLGERRQEHRTTSSAPAALGDTGSHHGVSDLVRRCDLDATDLLERRRIDGDELADGDRHAADRRAPNRVLLRCRGAMGGPTA